MVLAQRQRLIPNIKMDAHIIMDGLFMYGFGYFAKRFMYVLIVGNRLRLRNNANSAAFNSSVFKEKIK